MGGTALAFPFVVTAKNTTKVRIAAVGCGGKGWTDLNGAARHAELIAYCDVNVAANRKGGYNLVKEKWPQAKGYSDWREMFEKEEKNFDAVTVSTPDHMHAPVTMNALQLGKGTYTQKPMTRTIQEARAITEAAAKAGVPTQMGNQHHSGADGSAHAHVYSFALKPEEHQPSGTCNFSRIDNAVLNLNHVNVASGGKLKVYAVNYNVLRIMSGMGGLAYSN